MPLSRAGSLAARCKAANAVTPEQKARPGRGYGLRVENFAQKAKRGDSFILWRPGTGKSHWAAAIP